MRFEGRSIIVTGAGSGIGRASALRFAQEGGKVLAVDRDEAGVRETVERIAAAAGQAEAFVGDTGDAATVERFIGRAVQLFGGLDVLFANAGVSGGLTPIEEQTVDLWQEVLRINLVGTFIAVKLAAGQMVKQQRPGAIVCTASVAGLRANAGGGPYSASKAGVISLVQTTANALDGTGVRINAVCPGLIETGMTAPIFTAARKKGTQGKIGQLNPLRRAGVPEEIAATVLFLASDDASYINGQAFPVDGGLSSTLPFAAQRFR